VLLNGIVLGTFLFTGNKTYLLDVMRQQGKSLPAET